MWSHVPTRSSGPRWVAHRCQVGNFFEAVPRGGDAYILKNVLGNWDDDRAVAILRACRRAMGPRGTLLAIQAVVGPPNEGVRGAFTDLNMLLMEAGQQGRQNSSPLSSRAPNSAWRT